MDTKILSIFVAFLENMNFKSTAHLYLESKDYDEVSQFTYGGHSSYKWIIMLEKCGHPDLNVFHLKCIISAPMAIEKNLGLPAKQNCQLSPFASAV